MGEQQGLCYLLQRLGRKVFAWIPREEFGAEELVVGLAHMPDALISRVVGWL